MYIYSADLYSTWASFLYICHARQSALGQATFLGTARETRTADPVHEFPQACLGVVIRRRVRRRWTCITSQDWGRGQWTLTNSGMVCGCASLSLSLTARKGRAGTGFSVPLRPPWQAPFAAACAAPPVAQPCCSCARMQGLDVYMQWNHRCRRCRTLAAGDRPVPICPTVQSAQMDRNRAGAVAISERKKGAGRRAHALMLSVRTRPSPPFERGG